MGRCPAEVDDSGGVRLLVTDEIRRVRQTIEVELFENHRVSTPQICHGLALG
jgi:hypothetical protein